MGDNWLGISTAKKDLVVIVDYRLNINHNCDTVAKKANAILSCIKNRIVCKSLEVVVPLYQ